MSCSTGFGHTITLSDNGTVYSFGFNKYGQLGLGHQNWPIRIPKRISNLPKIKLVSCGQYFTICVDEEGFMWNFGSNYCGQLGTGNKKIQNISNKMQLVPFKIEDENIPPVQNIACGYEHTLIVSNNEILWSFGRNEYGQLCLSHRKNQLKPTQTSFENIENIFAGPEQSFFQNNKGEIYACGFNQHGELGLGHNYSPQVEVCLIPNQYLDNNIIRVCCGRYHSLFLDRGGNVFSTGQNQFGSLGLGNFLDQTTLNQISNIPPIKTISCVGVTSFLLDFDGNVWRFGPMIGNKKMSNRPKRIISLKDIKQISYGSCSNHFLAKDSQNRLFGVGCCDTGQLTLEGIEPILIPKQLKPVYSSIWGELIPVNSRAKSARK